MISRRELLEYAALACLCSPFARVAGAQDVVEGGGYPETRRLLGEVYRAEDSARMHYEAYCQQALAEGYPNIAYLFLALSVSERIHADNFRRIASSMGLVFQSVDVEVTVEDTKSNLNRAARKEIDKISTFYPEVTKQLAAESHAETIVNCMYSWKSHRQHEAIIRDIKRYSGFFFGSLARKIEGMNPNYFVCEICGSTMDEKPQTPCEICNYPMVHYKSIERPTPATTR